MEPLELVQQQMVSVLTASQRMMAEGLALGYFFGRRAEECVVEPDLGVFTEMVRHAAENDFGTLGGRLDELWRDAYSYTTMMGRHMR